MFDNVFNFIIVLIPLSIFIGRVVIQARSKHKPAVVPRPALEEKEEDVPHWERNANSATVNQAARRQTHTVLKSPLVRAALALKADAGFPPVSGAAKSPPAYGSMPRKVPAEVPRGKTINAALTPLSNPVNLGYLSPMQQAVVMAEILGAPKGMM